MVACRRIVGESRTVARTENSSTPSASDPALRTRLACLTCLHRNEQIRPVTDRHARIVGHFQGVETVLHDLDAFVPTVGIEESLERLPQHDAVAGKSGCQVDAFFRHSAVNDDRADAYLSAVA